MRTSLDHLTPTGRRRAAAAALVGLLFSWVIGATHLATYHGHGGHHAHVAIAEGHHDDHGPVLRTPQDAASSHTCAVVDLWSNLGGFSPGGGPAWSRLAPVEECVEPRLDAIAAQRFPLHYLAPKNSPPGRAARALG